MPDLTNTVLAQHFNRAEHEHSNYGTRRLQFFQVIINGYDITQEPNWNNNDPDNIDSYSDSYTSDHGHKEYLEGRKSIVYPVLRGIAQIGEIMYNGEFDNGDDDYEGNTYVIIALSSDTVSTTGAVGFNSETSKSLEQAITESITGFTNSGVSVNDIRFIGDKIQD